MARSRVGGADWRSQRVDEVKASIAHLLGCTPDELGHGAYARVVVTQFGELSDVLKQLDGPQAWPSMPSRWQMFGQEMQATEAALERVRAVTVAVGDTIRRKFGRAVIRRNADRPLWMLAQPMPLLGQQHAAWQVCTFTENGFEAGPSKTFAAREDALAHMAELGCVVADDMALERLARGPIFIRSQLLEGLEAEVESGRLTSRQASMRISSFDQDQKHVLSASAYVAQAFYVPSTTAETDDRADKVVLIADHIGKGLEQGVFLHEAVHKYARWMLGDLGFDRLVGRVMGWQARPTGDIERHIFEAAHGRASEATRGGQDVEKYREELLAYAVEEAVHRGVKPRAQAHVDSAERWLEDVVTTLQGVRDQLLKTQLPATAQDIVDMAYAMAQLDSPTRSEQIVRALLDRGEDPEFVRALKSFAEKSAFLHADVDLVAAIDRVYEDPRFYDLKQRHDGLMGGPFNEGSLISAKAIMQAAGKGELICITGKDSGPCQYGVEIDGFVYDFDGAHANRQAWLGVFETLAGLDQYEVREGEQEGALANDEQACAALAQLLGEQLAERLGEPQVGRPEIEPGSLPDCHFAGSLEALVVDDDYRLARGGREDAALRLAEKLITPEFLSALDEGVTGPERNGPLIVVPVVRMERGQANVAALAVASLLAKKLGGQLDTEIVQKTHPAVGALTVLDRIFARPQFSGHVVPQARYIIVDDRFHLGDSAAALAAHIFAGGGQVVGISAMYGNGQRAKMQAGETVVAHLRSKYGDLENDFEKASGITFGGLTDAQARGLAAYGRAQEVRNRITQEALQRGGSAYGADSPGQVSPGQVRLGELMASFVGARAINHDPHSLAVAMRRLQNAEPRELVFEETGWFAGPEGKWRYEIDDSKSRMLISGIDLRNALPAGLVTVGDILSHDRLFSAYPSLAQLQVECIAGVDGALASIAQRGSSAREFKIQLGGELKLHQAHSVLLHELQHAIQTIEGFAPGGDINRFKEVDITQERVGPINEQIMLLLDENPQFGALRREQNRDFSSILSQWGTKDEAGRERLSWDDVPAERREAYFLRLDRLDAYEENSKYIDLDMERRRLYEHRVILTAWDQYRHQAGEVEARNVQTRRSMAEPLRRMKAPWLSQDISPEQVIVGFNGLEGMLLPIPANALAPAPGQWSQSGPLAQEPEVNAAVWSVDEPSAFRRALVPERLKESAKIGDWVAMDLPDLRGTPVYQVRLLDLDALYLPELDEAGRLQPEKRAYLEPYVLRLEAGEVPPRIFVIEMEDGRLRVVDGHRRVMAARKAGRTSVEALVSPLVNTPEGLVPATAELMEYQLKINSEGRGSALSEMVHFSFAGESSRRASMAKLATAKSMVAGGRDGEEVRNVTGWFQGVDGLWREELTDHEATLNARLLANLAAGGWGACKAKSLSYRVEPEGTYHLVIVPQSAHKVADIVELKAVGLDKLKQLLPACQVDQILSSSGVPDWIGDFSAALMLNEEFKFPGFDALSLDEVLSHPVLFEAYPSLKKVRVSVHPSLGLGGVAQKHSAFTSITLGCCLHDADMALSILLHEAQHVIQDIEGYAPGGSAKALERVVHTRQDLQAKFDMSVADMLASGDPVIKANAAQAMSFYGKRLAVTGFCRGLSALEIYTRLVGEVEARNVQARLKMGEAQRMATPPSETEDVLLGDQILMDRKTRELSRPRQGSICA